MKQVALHMLKNANRFYPYVKYDLQASGESYESYCVNVYHGKVWGDDFLLSVIGHMFNIAITVISPVIDACMDLFHNKKVPNVVVIANGGDYLISKKPCTHFSGSHVKRGIKFDMPGSQMVNPKLDPVLFTGFDKGKSDSLQNFLAEEKDVCLS